MNVEDYVVLDAEGAKLGVVSARTLHEAKNRGRALALKLGRRIQGVTAIPVDLAPRRPPPPVVPRLPRRMRLVGAR